TWATPAGSSATTDAPGVFTLNQIRTSGRSDRPGLLAGPAWLALLDERAHPLAEIRASVRQADQILAARQAAVLLDPADRLLAHPQGDRRVIGDERSQRVDSLLDLLRRDDLVDEARGVSRVGGGQARRQQELLHT